MDEQAFETVAIGMTLLISQGVITTNRFFGEAEIREYLKVRKTFHPTFVESCAAAADDLEGTKYQAAVGPLRRISRMPPTQTSQALSQTAKAFRGLGRLRFNDFNTSRGTRVVRVLGSINRAADLLRGGPEEGGEIYWSATSTFNELFEQVIKLKSLPTKLKTLFRKMLKVGAGASNFNFAEESDPGAWFDMPPERRVAIRKQVKDLESESRALGDVYTNDPEGVQRRWKEISRELAALQGEAGVNLTIINRDDQVPLDSVLRKEQKLNVDGPTAFTIERIKNSIVSLWEEYPEQRLKMFSKNELRKLMTQISKVRTMDTLDRVLRNAVDRGLLSDSVLEDVAASAEKVSKNKAIRDGVPLLPLTWKPVTVGEFQESHGAGRVDFLGDWTEEQKQEILGKVSRAISDLETIYGKGFCGRHAKKLDFQFSDGSGVGGFARASYFGWEDRNRWQPRVKFGQDFEGLLAHELSHYVEDMLAYQIEDLITGVPEFQYGDVGHGPGDLFGRTGVTVDSFLDSLEWRSKNPKDPFKEFPEFAELMKAVRATPDYERWEQKLGAAHETALPRAIENVTGKSPYEMGDQGWAWIHAKYKHELPPEILEEAERVYADIMDGDTRKLTYYQSVPEVWARVCEQYVYTRLSEVGIANPWLTQLTYDVDVVDQFIDEETFEAEIKPVMDRLFKRLKERHVLARLVRAYLERKGMLRF